MLQESPLSADWHRKPLTPPGHREAVSLRAVADQDRRNRVGRQGLHPQRSGEGPSGPVDASERGGRQRTGACGEVLLQAMVWSFLGDRWRGPS
jgi:hypothetical protein